MSTRPKSSICWTAALPPLPWIYINPDFVYVYIYDTFTYLSQYLSITESIYEIIAKYQANDDKCCRNTSLKYTMTFYSLTSIYISH